MNKPAGALIAMLVVLGPVGCGDLHADESHTHSHPEADSSGHGDAHDDHHHDADEADGHHHDEDGHHDDEPMRHADAHSHGDAALAVALDGTALVIELDTPLYNLVGFEHAPQTADEVDALQRAQMTLARPGRLFSVNPEAGCAAEDLEDGVELMPAAGKGKAAKDETDSSGTHRDLVIEYVFECRSPGRIEAIDVHLFESFPRIEELESVYLDQNTQRSVRLTPDNHRIDIAR